MDDIPTIMSVPLICVQQKQQKKVKIQTPMTGTTLMVKKACCSCGLFGTRVDCPGRKCTEYEYVTKDLRVDTLVTICMN